MKNVCRFCGDTLQAEHYLDNGKPHTQFTCDKCQLRFLLPIVGLQSAKTFKGLASCPFCNANLSKEKLKTTLACNKCNIKLLSKDLSDGKGEVVEESYSGDENDHHKAVMSDQRWSSTDLANVKAVNDDSRVIRAVSDKSKAALRGFALKSTRAPTNP